MWETAMYLPKENNSFCFSMCLKDNCGFTRGTNRCLPNPKQSLPQRQFWTKPKHWLHEPIKKRLRFAVFNFSIWSMLKQMVSPYLGKYFILWVTDKRQIQESWQLKTHAVCRHWDVPVAFCTTRIQWPMEATMVHHMRGGRKRESER